MPRGSKQVHQRPKGAPAILPAQRVDWCTDEPVLAPVYEILGPEVGIDPAWNSQAIVRARVKLERPPGAKLTERVGGLAYPWHEEQTFFNNPPFGDGVLPMWVLKAIEEAKLGAEGIQLLPAYVSAHWFDDVYNNAGVISFWGLPGETNSRVQFLGAEHTATFPIMLVYYGDRIGLAGSVLARVGQIVVPSVMRAWLRMVRGHVIPGVSDIFDDLTLEDPIHAVLRRRERERYSPLIDSCAGISGQTVAELVEAGHPVVDDLLQLRIDEVAGGLAALQQLEPHTRSVATSRRHRRVTRPRVVTEEPPELDERQLQLVTPPTPAVAARMELDRQILRIVRERGEEGILSSDLRAKVGCTSAQFRGSTKRLRNQSLVIRRGSTTQTRYYAPEQRT